MQSQTSMSTGTTRRVSSPDFSCLTPDELERLEVVLQRQVLVENEQNQRLSGLRRTMFHLQQTIDYDRQRTFSSSSSAVQSSIPILSSSSTSVLIQCYICCSNIDIPTGMTGLSPPILCADCHRPVCRRCGNYTSPEFVHMLFDNRFQRQTQTSKWRCRMCIVRREVVRKSGSWNVSEDEMPMHSPVRLLQKLAAYRASTSSPMSSSSSPNNERKSTIFTESTNFFARLWRPTTSPTNYSSPTPSTTLMTSHQATLSSFDNIPESNLMISETTSRLTNRRMSFIREVSGKSPSQLPQFSPPPPPPLPPQLPPLSLPPFQSQPTISSTVTDPSFEDTTSEHPCDTASEIYSQSFETNIDSSNPGIDEEQQQQQQQQGLTYDERHRRLSYSAKPVISSIQQRSSFMIPNSGQQQQQQQQQLYYSDSLASPEANIDVSMAMDYFSKSMVNASSINDCVEPLLPENVSQSFHSTTRRTRRSILRNSDNWARKRALMHRGYQWTTTFEGIDGTSNTEQYQTFNDPFDSTYNVFHRRRSSRRLPAIPHSADTNDTNVSEEIILTSPLYSSTENPPPPSSSPLPSSSNNRSNRSKSIDSESSLKTRSNHPKLSQTHQSPSAKSVDLSNLRRRKSLLIVDSTLLPQRSLDYPCIVRKAQDLSDIVRRRMLYSKINKQSDQFSMSLEREHVPKVPRKIIIRQDNSIEIALSKPPKLRRQTLSEDYYGCNPESEFATIAQASNTSSTIGLTVPSSASGLPVGDRRKTIETCENIFLQAEESSKLRARTPPSNPHRVLLHRDKSDASIRTNGLGMRIVGGQECEDGSLGCFVTNIIHGGPADIQGNIEVGDQILEFNGHSLIDSTYEEVRILQDHCGDIVQLVVQHNNVRLQINGGQALSSMEISRHFETVPRLSTSITRKRRNLPPLPPTTSSTFAKQQKRDLYETVETLEVPNVKELKPILINRGRLLAQIWHDIEDMKLALTIIQAGNLPLRPNGDQPYTFITGKMLFEDRGFDMFETKVIHSSNPVYNETFVFHEVENVDVLHLEVLLWDKKQYHSDHFNNINRNDDPDEFLGMVQLPLNEANLEDEPRWYELRDRQTRKPSTSSVTFKSSSAESGESCRKMPPFVVSNKNVEHGKASNDLLTRVLHRSAVRKIDLSRRTSSPSKNTQRTSTSNTGVPSITMTSIDDEDDNSRRTTTTHSQSVKLRRRISKGILKFFDTHTRRASESTSKTSSLPSSPITRKSSTQMTTNIDSEDDLDVPTNVNIDNTPIVINKSPRQSTISTIHDEQTNLARSIPLQQMPIGQLMLPYIPSSRHSSISGSRKSSATSYYESDDDIDRYFTLVEQQQEQTNESTNVQTHTVGPGQVTPRNYENMINDYIYMGQIQLGLIVTKGLLEIDVIAAKKLERVIDENGNHTIGNRVEDHPPDTYVKTYLRTGTRRVQKRKTATVKGSYNPEYHAKLKYNACNVMGRRLQVTVWQRAGKFEKNQCIGEAFIQLDNLTLTQHTVAWYKLFREKLVESEFYDSS